MNILFTGLTVSEASKLGSYMHFREPYRLNEKSLLEKANLEKSIDFLDTLEEDIPRGKSCRNSILITLVPERN